MPDETSLRTGPQRITAADCESLVCPSCGGLECPCKPLFYPGQLLTEEDLNALDRYIGYKNRLHNRYLHGSGVVCGLKVLCHPCDGWVTITRGYALDLCGNDIIVCDDEEFNLIKRIRECRRARPTAECDPWRFGDVSDCADVEEEWCITIRYREWETRPTGAYQEAKRSKKCGCSPTSACSCGCNGSGKRPASTARRGPGPIVACEPTRTCEGYHLDAIRSPEGTADHSGTSSLDRCRLKVQELINRRPKITISPTISSEEIRRYYRLCCRFREEVYDLLMEFPLTHCDLSAELQRIQCYPPGDHQDLNAYAEEIQDVVEKFREILETVKKECLCLSRLPDCPPETHDNCLLLARVTVRGDRILDICHFSCRQQLREVPAFDHRPLSPGSLAFWQKECCEDDSEPYFPSIRPAHYIGFDMQRLGQLSSQWNMPDILAFTEEESILAEEVDEDMVSVRHWRYMEVEAVKARLEAENLAYVVEPIDEVPEQILAMKTALEPAVFSREEPLVVQTRGRTVVGFDSLSEETRLKHQIEAQSSELQELRRELETLRSEVASIGKSGAQHGRK